MRGGRWERGDQRWLPLYEGKMVQAYDHRAASIIINVENLNRPAQPAATSPEHHQNPAWSPNPQFWVANSNIPEKTYYDWALAFKDVTSPTNVRTFIAAIVPGAAYGNTVPILYGQPSGSMPCKVREQAWPLLLVANLNSVALDYVSRQKVQGQHLNFYVVEQLPVIESIDFARQFGIKTAETIIREDVLHLTYTSHDMQAFARDQGFDGPPFSWDEEDRLRRRARLDAIFFHLYGIDRADADYILSAFPIVRREEEQRYGSFRSRTLILAYMAALAAGRPDAEIAG